MVVIEANSVPALEEGFGKTVVLGGLGVVGRSLADIENS